MRVGDQPVTEPNEGNGYEWQNRLSPGKKREAVVRYRVLGAVSWHYDLGSRRRRVQEFHLEAVPGGPVRFARGSLEPTRSAGGTLQWELSNVVTAQQIALSFPRDVAGRDSYLQALSAFPLSLLVFGIGVLGLGWLARVIPAPAALAGGVLAFTLGLGAAAILANYVGPVAAVILAPLGGAVAAAGVLGRRSLLAALPAALLPAAFLSPTHSGLLILVLAVLTGVVFSILIRSSEPRLGAPSGDESPAYS